MGQLVNIDNLRIVSAVCSSGGATLHNQVDCPRDRTCPVYASFHRIPLTFAEAKEEIDRIVKRDRGLYTTMRHEARQALEADYNDYPEFYEGADIGSSDVSIKVIEMYRFGEMEV